MVLRPTITFLTVILLCSLAGAAIKIPWPPGHDASELFPSRGDTLLVTFPVEFDVSPNNRLYLRGERITRVCLTTTPGDTLLVNGIPVMPPGKCPRSAVVHPEEYYLRIVGEVPYVRNLIDTMGVDASEASERFLDAMQGLPRSAAPVYWDARERGASEHAAAEEAFEAMRSLDSDSLVAWDESEVAYDGVIRVLWKGLPGQRDVRFEGCGVSARPPAFGGVEPSRPAPRSASRATDAAAYAVRLFDAMTSSAGPVWRVISCGGRVQFGGTENAARAEEALEAALNSEEFEEDPLSRQAVLEIISHEQATASP